MPKQKSKSSATKRMTKKKSGKVMRRQGYSSHLFSNKSQKQKRHHRKGTTVSSSDLKRYKGVL